MEKLGFIPLTFTERRSMLKKIISEDFGRKSIDISLLIYSTIVIINTVHLDIKLLFLLKRENLLAYDFMRRLPLLEQQ